MTHELVLIDPAAALHIDAQAHVPGAVIRDAQGEPMLLHFAPGRWLVPDEAEGLALIAGLAGTVLLDVEGKWQRRTLRGAQAFKDLVAGADVEAILADRDCAALTLFDCPVVIARSGERFDLWINSSYARSLDLRFAGPARPCKS